MAKLTEWITEFLIDAHPFSQLQFCYVDDREALYNDVAREHEEGSCAEYIGLLRCS